MFFYHINKTIPIYFINTFEDTVIMFDGIDGYLAKQRGKIPYPIEHSTIMVTDAILESNQISEEDFNNF